MTAARRIRFRTADQLTIVGDEFGDPAAPAVILMHGGGQTRHSWSRTADTLAQRGYRVISYDARGHGESEWSAEGNYRIIDRVEDLRTVLSAIDTPYILVGASMGGMTALYATALGIVPSVIVLVDIVFRPDRAGIQRILDFMLSHSAGFGSVGEAMNAVISYNPERSRSPDTVGLRKNLRRAEDGRFYWHWDPRILDDAQQNADNFPSLIEKCKIPRELPVLLVRGAQSDVVTLEGVQHMRSIVPQLDVRGVAGAGHMVVGDRSDIFSLVIIEYIMKIVPPKSD